jgi:hypothetical protein
VLEGAHRTAAGGEHRVQHALLPQLQPAAPRGEVGVALDQHPRILRAERGAAGGGGIRVGVSGLELDVDARHC